MRLVTRFVVLSLVSAVLLTSAACGAEVDLAKSAQIVDAQTGYYDMGVIDGKTKLVPQALVRVKNVSDRALSGFQISASFWRTGDDGMADEMIHEGNVAKDLAPGATSEPILLRGNVGYTLDVSRAEAFQNSLFRDFSIKVFGKVGGRIAKLGEVNVERKIIPKDATPASSGAVPTK